MGVTNRHPTREHSPEELRLSAVLADTRERLRKLDAEAGHHKRFIQDAQEMCGHDWRGQDNIHPHGTPSETFVCTICGKEEVR